MEVIPLAPSTPGSGERSLALVLPVLIRALRRRVLRGPDSPSTVFGANPTEQQPPTESRASSEAVPPIRRYLPMATVFVSQDSSRKRTAILAFRICPSQRTMAHAPS